jgi:ribosome-associated protein
LVLDLRGLSDVTDAFVICHGSTERQTAAIADAIEQRLRETHGRRPGHVEGKRSGEWILMDYLDFVVHVFTPETRSYYGLERLWGDAPRLSPAATERRATRRSPSATA